MDPWFSPEGAFFGSWFQFPDNSHLLDRLEKPTAVVISHEHLDHVDPWFLARLPADVPAIVPRYPSPVLKQKILRGGPRKIIELAQWEVFEPVKGVRLFFVSEPPMNHDSAMVLEADGYTLLNMNDARLFPVQLREIRRKVGGEIDVFALQGAGASWYPMCYSYPPEKSAERSHQKRQTKFQYCLRTMKVVEPKVGLPFAGPPAFLDPALFQHNHEMEEGIFPDQQQLADWLNKCKVPNTAVLLPGDTWDAEAGRKVEDPFWEGFSFENRWDYLKSYAERRSGQLAAIYAAHPEPADSLWKPFEAYFQRLLEMSPYFNSKINMRVAFDIEGPGGGQWTVDFRPGREGVSLGIDEHGYLYRFASRWLPPLLDGRQPWEDFFLSLRFEASRNPDRYNDHLLGLLKFAEPKALREVEKFERTLATDARMTLHVGGKTLSVSRYCPHAGTDLLQTGELLPSGVLRCLAHHYDFDLQTGRCLNGNCEDLKIEILTKKQTPLGLEPEA
jgi:UDP-MurNAc hydroxylase